MIAKAFQEFDLAQLNAEDVKFVSAHTRAIRKIVGKLTPEQVIEVGRRLIEVKERISHGLFLKWIEAEFDWGERTSQNMMATAVRFKSEIIADLKIAPTALYELASPSIPDQAVREAIERAESGEKITASIAKEICKQHKPPKPEPEFNAETTLEKVKKAIEAIEQTVPDDCKEWFGEYLILLGKQIVGRAQRC